MEDRLHELNCFDGGFNAHMRYSNLVIKKEYMGCKF